MPDTFSETGGQPGAENNQASFSGASEGGDPSGQASGNVFLEAAGRRFAAAEEVTKQIEAEQAHIAKLEEEARKKDELIAKLEKQSETGTTLDAVLDKLTAVQSESGTSQGDTGISKDELVKTVIGEVTSQMRREQNEVKRQSNFNDMIGAAQKAYGKDTADTRIQEKCAELGVNFDYAVDMAKSNPSVFQRLFLPKQDAATRTSEFTPGTVRTSTDNQEQKPERVEFLKLNVKQRAKRVQELLAENPSQ